MEGRRGILILVVVRCIKSRHTVNEDIRLIRVIVIITATLIVMILPIVLLVFGIRHVFMIPHLNLRVVI